MDNGNEFLTQVFHSIDEIGRCSIKAIRANPAKAHPSLPRLRDRFKWWIMGSGDKSLGLRLLIGSIFRGTG